LEKDVVRDAVAGESEKQGWEREMRNGGFERGRGRWLVAERVRRREEIE
jgi:hypothetical protein